MVRASTRLVGRSLVQTQVWSTLFLDTLVVASDRLWASALVSAKTLSTSCSSRPFRPIFTLPPLLLVPDLVLFQRPSATLQTRANIEFSFPLELSTPIHFVSSAATLRPTVPQLCIPRPGHIVYALSDLHVALSRGSAAICAL